MNNSTLPSNSSSLDYRFLLCTYLNTGIFFAILSPITITSNVLLLFTIFKDPLKCFRTPATYFIGALALVDLTTVVIVEPFTAIYRVASYEKWSLTPGKTYHILSQTAMWFSYVDLNSSFLLVVGLIVTQFIAITYPHRYRSVVTTRRILACIGLSLVYFTGFIMLQFVRVPTPTLYQVDLHLHSTLITILLIVGSAMLLRSYRKYVIATRHLLGARSLGGRDAGAPHKNRRNKRQVTIVTLLLSGIFIVCTLSHIVTVHISVYTKQETLRERLDLFAVVTIVDEMTFVKVALDAFIYAWRLLKYRRSLKQVLTYRGTQVASEAIEMRIMNNFTVPHQHPETLIMFRVMIVS